MEETTTKAKSLGATILAPTFDVMDAGRMSVIRTHQAALSLWQAKTHSGATVWGGAARSAGSSSLTPNVDAAVRLPRSSSAGRSAEHGRNDVRPSASATTRSRERADPQDDGPRPAALEHVLRDSTTVTALGGGPREGQRREDPRGTQDVPTVGRFSTVQDPQGAVFNVIKLAPTTKK